MSFEDIQLECSDCGAAFSFTAEEQELFQTRGYTNKPKRCPGCRQTRRARNSNGIEGSTSTRQTFPAVCSACGKDTQLPFEPRTGRPVYCSDCYRKVKVSR